MTQTIARATEGLEDVIAGTSEICFVDGREGRLIYRGYDIRDLAEHATFEEVLYLLWYSRLPTRPELDELTAQLEAHRPLQPPLLDLLRSFPRSASPMHVLRTAVSALALWDPAPSDNAPSQNQRKAILLTAQLPTILGTWERLRSGKEVLAPRPGRSTAWNLLYLIRGSEPDEEDTHILDVALILQADHELNASTFAARVTTSTLSDLFAAVTTAIGTLAGPLHGGANEAVMHTLQRIGSVDRAEAWVLDELAQHHRIMGFGHRVYKTYDPRALILRRYSERLGRKYNQPHWYQISRRIEEVMLREKHLYPNVDFYSASVYHLLGIPTDLCTPVFACSRMAGYTAHILEQYADNRLIRPRAEYTGPVGLTYVPLDQRS